MSLRQSPLTSVHEAADANLTEFGGWEMPVEFDSIRTEHEAVREAAGKFDVSHMGEIIVSGPDARELTNRLTTNDVGALDPGDAQYAAITNQAGNMIDDTIVYRFPRRGGASGSADENDTCEYLFIPNAGHDDDAYHRWITHRDEWELQATVENETEAYAMIALQGPDSVDVLAPVADGPVDDVSFFTAEYRSVADVDCLISRSGYTGEDGFELLFNPSGAEAVWAALDCQPCGLGARDTLRLESGFLLSGQDFDVEENPRTPFQAGIDFAVDLDSEFVGRDALVREREEGVDERLVGLQLVDRGIARHGYDVAVDGEMVGTVTSGSASPTLGESIALAYLPVEYAHPGTDVDVHIRGSPKAARVVELPFYSR
ncbi:MAG: glycine cleavage system aminomethyltransferase GcvT [Natronomonas sp.]